MPYTLLIKLHGSWFPPRPQTWWHKSNKPNITGSYFIPYVIYPVHNQPCGPVSLKSRYAVVSPPPPGKPRRFGRFEPWCSLWLLDRFQQLRHSRVKGCICGFLQSVSQVKNPTRTMGATHPSNEPGWIDRYMTGRWTKDHVLMEVWFRSFSFLNGWFVGGVHDWLMFMGKFVDIPVTWIQESELSFQFRFCVKIQWLDETCFIYLSLRRIRCLACLKHSWCFAERVHYHIKYVLKINSTYKMNGLVQIDEFLQFTQMIGPNMVRSQI